jgi:gas vesicle protein
MESHSQQPQAFGFSFGLITGALVGAGLAWWLTPGSASELRERVTVSARALGKRASETYDEASSRIGDAVDQLTRKGRAAKSDSGAQE